MTFAIYQKTMLYLNIPLLVLFYFLILGCQNEPDKSDSLSGHAANEEVARLLEAFEGRGALTDDSKPIPAIEALSKFKVAPDLELDVVLSEPQVNQPLEVSFDTKGRMWVVHYNQYPFPAGLKITGLDNHLRVQFDTIPLPPPAGEKGADKITIFEDTNGDGLFDKSTDAISGLNIATSVALGYGKIWVLNPPYLIAYPDPDGDGIPDGDPEVHLQGFGLQDTHAVANSLRWGPDGWLYGAQGSTTTSRISSATTKDVFIQGQTIWRYHPETKIFEIFAEGGGNTFNVEFDSKGRIYSGHNGYGRGPYYKQGGYYLKSWGKHGPLTNPYAFGYLKDMEFDGEKARFTHAILRYEGGQLPKRYEGDFIALNPLQGNVVLSEFVKNGSTARTVDQDTIVDTEDRWFRPIDIQTGPDGMVYITDWYDSRLSHVDPRDTWNKTSGRIYRLRKKDSEPGYQSFDLTDYSNEDLIGLFSSKNRWFRQKALQIIRDRNDKSILPMLKSVLKSEKGQIALEAFWAIYLAGGLDDAMTIEGINHTDPYVRMWSVRLTGDQNTASEAVAQALAGLSRTETDVEVRSQIAASAKRLPGKIALPIMKNLLLHHEDSGDPDIPLQIWWALESKAESDRDGIVSMFGEKSFWSIPIVKEVVLSRLMQRYILPGGRDNYETARRLFQLAPDKSSGEKLMNGLQEGLRGKSISDLPANLVQAMKPYQATGEGQYAMALRQKTSGTLQKVMDVVKNQKADLIERLAYIRILGEAEYEEAVPALLDILKRPPIEESRAVKISILNTLQRYDQPVIAKGVLGVYPGILREDPEVRLAALNLLISRPGWADLLLNEIEGTSVIHKEDVPVELARHMLLFDDGSITERVHAIWPATRSSSSDEISKTINKLADVIQSGQGDEASGKLVFRSACGICHRLNEEGGNIGPDLTGYDRTNLSYMLLQVVDPNADIREGYVYYLIHTKDGRTLSGFLTERTDNGVTVQPYGGEPIQLSMKEIEKLEPQQTSLMPEGILERLSDTEVRDLFAYLMDKI